MDLRIIRLKIYEYGFIPVKKPFHYYFMFKRKFISYDSIKNIRFEDNGLTCILTLSNGTRENVYVSEKRPTNYDIDGYIKLMELLIRKFPKVKHPNLFAVKRFFNSYLYFVKNKISSDTHYKEIHKMWEINKDFTPSERKFPLLVWRNANQEYILVFAIFSLIFLVIYIPWFHFILYDLDGPNTGSFIFLSTILTTILLLPVFYFYIRIGGIIKNYNRYQTGNTAILGKLRWSFDLLANKVFKGLSLVDIGPKKEFLGLKFDGRYKITNEETNETIFLKFFYMKKSSWHDYVDIVFYLGPINDTNLKLANDLKWRIKKLEAE